MNSYKKSALLTSLSVLKDQRKDLVERLVNEDPDLFMYIWIHHNNEESMSIVLEYFVITWINSHWQQLAIYTDSFSEKEKDFCAKFFCNTYYSLIKKITKKFSEKFEGDAFINSSIFMNCAKENENCLKSILHAYQKSSTLKNKLSISMFRHKELFKREFDRLNKNK